MSLQTKVVNMLGGLLLGGSLIPTGFDDKVEKFRKEQLPLITRAQEQELGIKYVFVPQVCGFIGERTGAYNAYENIILLNGTLFIEDLPLVTVRTTNHELGHCYVDQRSEALGKGNWPTGATVTSQKIAERLLGEGIAKYFEVRMERIDAERFSDADFPKTLDDFFIKKDGVVTDELDENIMYAGGYQLVKPILDVNVQRGVEYVLQHLPNEVELLNLPAYREKVLKDIKTLESLEQKKE